jgi:TolB protein
MTAAGAMVIALTVIVGTALPKSDQLLFSSAPGWRPGPWEVFIMDVGRQIAHRVADNRTAGNPGLPVEWSPDGLRIAYTSYPRRREAYLFDLVNGQRYHLNSPEMPNVYNPVWSPDSQRVAFVGGDLRMDIYVVDANGENMRNLTQSGEGYNNLAWSPDSRQIAFNTLGAGSGIYVVDLDSGDIYNLTDNPSRNVTPTWSPDGQQIAFISDMGGDGYHLYVMNSDGSSARPLTRVRPVDTGWEIGWSPDSQRIVFGSNNWGGGSDVYLIDLENNQVRNITHDDTRDANPVWSPDGDHIAFESHQDGRWNIFLVDSDGGNRRRLTGANSNYRRPVWSPNGDKIAFMSNLERGWDIYLMDVPDENSPDDISYPIRLTISSGIHFSPTWRP